MGNQIQADQTGKTRVIFFFFFLYRNGEKREKQNEGKKNLRWMNWKKKYPDQVKQKQKQN